MTVSYAIVSPMYSAWRITQKAWTHVSTSAGLPNLANFTVANVRAARTRSTRLTTVLIFVDQ